MEWLDTGIPGIQKILNHATQLPSTHPEFCLLSFKMRALCSLKSLYSSYLQGLGPLDPF